MQPYYDRDGITIYHGDAHGLLPRLAPVDLVLTDPPYNAINRETGGLRAIDKGEADSAPIDIPLLAAEFVRLAQGSIYVWCSGEQYTGWTVAFKDAGLTTRHCAWWKSDPSPMNGEHLWLSAMELCVFARKGGAYFSPHCKPPVWRGPVARDDAHPCAKPEWLMRTLLLASCPPGGIVLDPFMGRGTTLRAALDTGRRAVGIDNRKHWCAAAARRLGQMALPLACD